MATLKLTAGMRDGIVERVVRHRFEPERLAIDAERQALARAVYEHIYSGAVRCQLAALPAGFVPEDVTIYVRFGHEPVTVSMTEPARQTYRHHRTYFNLDVGHPLCERWAALRERSQSYQSRQRATGAQVRAVVGSCTTLRRLLETWPEVAPFCANLTALEPRLPVALGALNVALGLPVEEAA